MKKADIFRLILGGAAAFVPGGDKVKQGIEAIIEARQDKDDDDDFDEIAEAVALIAIGSVQGAEALSAKDLLNDPVLAQLAENIKGDLKLAQLLKVRPAPSPTI